MAELNSEFVRKYKPLSFNAILIRGSTSVKVSTPQNWLNLVEFLDSKGVPFRYSHGPLKTTLLVIRDVPSSVGEEAVAEELFKSGFETAEVTNMKSACGDPYPLYRAKIVVKPGMGDIFALNGLCYYRIKVEPFQTKRTPTQCGRCQEYYHTIETCRNSPRCRACAGEHLTRLCRQPRDAP